MLAAVSTAVEPVEPSTAIRPFPYPFEHMVTFASDVDAQTPRIGRAVHRLINETIRLPISDSLWVTGSYEGASALFAGGDVLNRSPSGVSAHPTFGLLLREWHRGNIDHFHSWQDDSAPTLRDELPGPIRLRSEAVSIAVGKTPASLRSLHYRNLRLYFDSKPPDDLAIQLTDVHGRVAWAPPAMVRAGRAVRPDDQPPHVVELLFGVGPDHGIALSREQFDLLDLESLVLHSASCRGGCSAQVQRLERDSFSRRTVLLQLPWLTAFNVRPVLLTSHGGWSGAQNFGPENFAQVTPRTPGSIYEHPLVHNIVRRLADRRDEHAFHADALRRLGVDTVWGMPGDLHLWTEPTPPVTFAHEGFYSLQRTHIGQVEASSAERFEADLVARDSLLRRMDLRAVHCAENCGDGAQGALLGLLIGASLVHIDAGRPVDHIWATHFSSGDSRFERTDREPLPKSAVAWLERLAQYHYDFSGRMPASRRTWVAPAGTVARYRMVQPRIGARVAVHQSTSRISITPWKDPVTGRDVPDVHAGTRDLHGITVYVPNAEHASVSIGGIATESFTRNAADATGRQSITLVDDSTPTIILDEVALTSSGNVEVSDGLWSDVRPHKAAAASGNAYASLHARGSVAQLHWRPNALDLWNTTHLRLAYRKIGKNGVPARGRFRLEIEMADGGRIVVAESAADISPPAAQWLIPPAKSDTWNHRVLALADLDWRDVTDNRHALPIGRVRRLGIALVGSADGERLDVDNIASLRPNANAVDANGGKLVAGQVLLAPDKPARRILVELALDDNTRRRTLSDRHGYFFFTNIPRGRVASLSAVSNGSTCAPRRGTRLQIMKDEAEIDFDLSRCNDGVR